MTLSRSTDRALGALLSLLLLALNVGAVSSQLGFLHKAKQVKEYDHWVYIAMARGEQGRAELRQQPPYCYRLAIPALARALMRAGFSENAAFFTLTNAALFGFLLLLWLHLRDLGFDLWFRVTGLLVTGLTQGAVRWFEYQYWMTDPAGLFLVMLAFVLVERRLTTAFALTSIAAAFVRETYVLVYPYAFLHELRCRLRKQREEASGEREAPESAAGAHRSQTAAEAAATAAPPHDFRASAGDLLRAAVPSALRTLAIAALPFAIMVALRMTVQANKPDSFVVGIVDSMGFRWEHRSDNQAYVLTIGSFGVLVPLVLLFPGRLLALATRHFDRALFVLSVYASLTISNNNERPLSYALPALVPAALFTLRSFLRQTGLPTAPVLGLVVALQLVFWLGQRFLGAGISIYQPVNWTTVLAMAAAWIAAQAVLARASRRGAQ